MNVKQVNKLLDAIDYYKNYRTQYAFENLIRIRMEVGEDVRLLAQGLDDAKNGRLTEFTKLYLED